MAKGFVSQFADAARIVDGVQIDSLDQDFSLPGGGPFTIQLVPKSEDNTKEFERVKIRFYQGEDHILWPIPVLSWCSEMIISISSESASLLNFYDIYVGTGADIPNN